MKTIFNNNNLNFDIEKIQSYSVVNALVSKDDNLDQPFILDVNDNSYFYDNVKERNQDFNKLIQIT